MLKFLRNKKTQKQIYIILAIVIIPPFLFWGVMVSKEDKKTNPATALGRIEDRSISVQEYLKSYHAVQHQVALVYGERAKMIARFIDFKAEAWDRLLLLSYAKSEKLKAGDSEVVDYLASQPIFLNHGKFDDKFYKAYVSNYLRMSLRDFEEEIRQMLTIHKIQEKIAQGVQTSEEELKELYNSEYGEKDIVYGIHSWESEKNKVLVSEEEISAVYPLLKDRFQDPERVKINYIFVPKENGENLKAALGERGLSLEALSKKYDLAIKETGFFSKNESIPTIGLSKDILSASFSLPLNQESGWIQTDNGAYKITVTKKSEARPLSFEEAKNQLKDLMIKQKATKAAVKRLDQIRGALGAANFEKTLTDQGIEVRHAEKFTAESYLPGVGLSHSFEKMILGLKEGGISQAFATPSGAAIIQIVKASPADPQKFEKDKTGFREKIANQKMAEKMDALLSELRQKLTLNPDVIKTLFPSSENQ